MRLTDWSLEPGCGGGVISHRRDRALIQNLVDQARAVALCRPLLVAVDGLASYVGAFQRAFRSPLPRWGQPGRCQLRPWAEVAIVQVVKQRLGGQLSIVRRIVQGRQTESAILQRVMKIEFIRHSYIRIFAYLQRSVTVPTGRQRE